MDAEEGELSDDGVIVFDNDNDVTLYSQTEVEMIGDEPFVANRMLIQIDNPQAPHEDTFDFDLPAGYRIVEDKIYNEEQKQELLAQKEMLLESGLSEAEFEEPVQNLYLALALFRGSLMVLA